ncbi:Uncharacterized amino acid permease, GabP family [hydrothermal vent metagenome]|uniref:Uncharacterized amino acid permease, GabP family n=1 Tax=hydrothermal vent metagenome TaxID=652676 RepID=A0A3B1CDC4_9ZZZZ
MVKLMDRNNAQEGKLGLKEIVAMGIGGMVGGGIFSVLGLSAELAGHAAPLAFAFGGLIALLTGLSYSRLGLAFKSDGGSFTYLEHAFSHRNIAGMGGWLLLVGYIGTLALYAFTFGMYGVAMLESGAHNPAIQRFLQSFILALFLGVNLYSVKAAGRSEEAIVLVKVLILSLFAIVGLFYIREDHILPLLNNGEGGVLMAAALIFVAYEGFELIPNAVNEMKNPGRDLHLGIMISIVVTIIIYILVSLVAVGNLSASEISQYKESALAVAAKPFLGRAGFALIALGALLSTASAINATLFGTARLAMVMGRDSALPKVFCHRERTRDIPWVSLVVITCVTLVFVNLCDLTMIAAFASSTFLLIFAIINLSAFRLRKRIGIGALSPLAGIMLCLGCWAVLCFYLWENNRLVLAWMAVFYVGTAIAELGYSERKLALKWWNNMS